jgi:ATP-dependent exoDNAse (exonuclease V) beta subunit
LDFDHLIIVGASEGSLPRIKPPDSFLPDNVRRAFGLPVPEHQDAIFAYVFYRLLHRAKTVQMLYNALVTDNSNGEISRFAKQLAFETKIPISKSTVSNAVFPESWPAITIEKNSDVLNRLFHYHKNEKPQTISPSAINTYLNCQLSFFFKYLAKLEEKEQLEEGVESAAVGKVLHKLMELLYQTHVAAYGNHITKDGVAWMKDQAESFIETAFRKSWRNVEITGPFQFSGELHVVRAIVLQYTHFLLDLDASYAPFTLHEMEVKFQQPFGINIQGRLQQITLSGYIDRIDEKDGVFRMVDYKTGGDDPNFKSMNALFERDGKGQNKAALQTLIYSWMFHKKYPQHEKFQPALLAIRHLQLNEGKVQLFNKEEQLPVDHQTMPQTLLLVEERLRGLLEELFDASVPFAQTQMPENCTYCDFKGICAR